MNAQAKAVASGPKARVLIVDDHEIVCMGLRTLIDREKDLEVCGDAQDSAEAIRLLEALAPDIVIVDLSLADESGLELVKDIVLRNPAARILIHSMLNETIYAERAMKAGAMGYVMKQDHPDMLIQALRSVLNNELHMGHAVTQQIARRMMNTGHFRPGNPTEILTDRELQVFERIGDGFAAGEIAASMNLSVKTIGTYRERIKIKLGLPGARELAHCAVAWMRRQHP
jgi:DNA-binding NarL/FixJ family response regulator